MATGRREYELTFMLKAAIDSGFASSFKNAASVTKSLQTQIENTNKVRSNITSYQKQQSALEKNEAKLAAQKAEYEKLAAEMAATQNPSEKLTEKFERKEAQIAKTTEAVEKNKNNLKHLEGELQDAGVDTHNLTGELEELTRAHENLRNAQAELGRLDSAISANKADLSEAKSSFMTTVNTIEMVGQSAYNGIIKPTMALESEMSKVEAISGATAEDMIQLQEKAKELGVSTKFTATEAAEGFEYMAMAGWKTADMLSGIDGILKLAAASGEDLGTTSDIVTDALTAFGLKASDSAHFADVLAAASSNSNTNVALLGESFKYAAPLAGTFGFSIEDTAIALGLMANSGIKASQSGTSLRSIFTTLTSDLKIAQKNGEELVVTTKNEDGSMRSLKEIIDDLRVAFNGMSEEQKNAIGENLTEQAKALGVQLEDENGKLKSQADLYADVAEAVDGLSDAEKVRWAKSEQGKTAMAGFLTLVNASEEDYNKLTDAIYNCEGATQRMADTMMDNLEGDLTLMGSASEGLAIALGSALTPTLREATQALTEKTSALANWIGENPKAVKTAAGVITALAGLKVGALGAKVGFLEVKGAVLNAKKVFTEMKIASQYLDGSLETASNTTKMFAGALGFIKSPVGIATVVITALAGAGLLIYHNYKKSREELLHFADGLKEATDNYEAMAEKQGSTQALIDEYRTLEAKVNDVTTSEEEAVAAKERMKDIEDILIEQNPNVLSRYDQENGKISENLDLLEEKLKLETDLAKATAEEKAYEASKQLPEARKRIPELEEDIAGYKEQYAIESAARNKVSNLMTEWEKFEKQTHTAEETTAKIKELGEAASEIMKTLGEDYDFSGSGIAGIATTLQDLENRVDKTKEAWDAADEELNTHQQNIKDVCNSLRDIIGSDIGGSFQDVANSFSVLKSARDELANSKDGILSEETINNLKNIIPGIEEAENKGELLNKAIQDVGESLNNAETKAQSYGTSLNEVFGATDGYYNLIQQVIQTDLGGTYHEITDKLLSLKAAQEELNSTGMISDETMEKVKSIAPELANAEDKNEALKGSIDELEGKLSTAETRAKEFGTTLDGTCRASEEELETMQGNFVLVSAALEKVKNGVELTQDEIEALEKVIPGIAEEADKPAILQTAFDNLKNTLGYNCQEVDTLQEKINNLQSKDITITVTTVMKEIKAEIEHNARGTDYSSDTFIAGEEGAELITGQEGKKVFTAFQTRRIFANMREIGQQAQALTAAGSMLSGNKSIRGFAVGTNRTPDTFIAGEYGAELIADYAGAVRAMEILNYNSPARTMMAEAPTVMENAPSGNEYNINITFSPNISSGDNPNKIKDVLQGYTNELADVIMRRIEEISEDKRRMAFV